MFIASRSGRRLIFAQLVPPRASASIARRLVVAWTAASNRSSRSQLVDRVAIETANTRKSFW
jgi:hypothetical protein